MHCPNNALHQLLELIIIDYSRMCITARDVTRPQSFQQLSNMPVVFVSSEAKNRLEPQFCPGNRSLVLVPTEKTHSCSTVHSRAREYDGRLPVEAPKRQDGLGVRTHHFQLCEHSVGPLQVDVFATRFSSNFPVSSVGDWTPNQSHRCFFTELDQYPRLCTSFFVPNFTSPSESSSRPSNSGTHHPIIAHAVMVPSLNEPPGRLSTPPAKDGRGNKAISELHCPIQGLPPQLVAWRVSGRDSEQKRFQTRLSNSSCPPGETKLQLSVESLGVLVCSKRCSSLFVRYIQCLDFLTEKYAAGLKYRSLNCYRMGTFFSTVAS